MLKVYCKQHLGPRREKAVWLNVECTYLQPVDTAPDTGHGGPAVQAGHSSVCVHLSAHLLTAHETSQCRLRFCSYTQAVIAPIILKFSYPFLAENFQVHFLVTGPFPVSIHNPLLPRLPVRFYSSMPMGGEASLSRWSLSDNSDFFTGSDTWRASF